MSDHLALVEQVDGIAAESAPVPEPVPLPAPAADGPLHVTNVAA